MDLSGSKYKGSMKDRRMHGKGVYAFPTGSVYDGEFRDGMFHGSGKITFRNGGQFVGEWRKGLAVEGRYVFADGLAMDDKVRPYCLQQMDRRFHTEREDGLKPAGRCQLTNKDPPSLIPAGHYDPGNGFFDPRTKLIVDPEKLLFKEHPKPETQNWIARNCRKGWDEEVGFVRTDYSRPHPSDRSAFVGPEKNLEEVELPPGFIPGGKKYRRFKPIPPRLPLPPLRQFEIPLEITRESETAMMDAAQAAPDGRRLVREAGLRGLAEAELDYYQEKARREKEGRPGQDRRSFHEERHPLSQFGATVGEAALSSASTSASSIEGGFCAARRRRSVEEEERKERGEERRRSRRKELERKGSRRSIRSMKSGRKTPSLFWLDGEGEEEEEEEGGMKMSGRKMMMRPKSRKGEKRDPRNFSYVKNRSRRNVGNGSLDGVDRRVGDFSSGDDVSSSGEVGRAAAADELNAQIERAEANWGNYGIEADDDGM